MINPTKKLKLIAATLICTLTTAILSPGTATAQTDYDRQIAELEERQKQIAAQNAQREKDIERHKEDQSQQAYLITLVEEQIEGLKEEVAVREALINEKLEDITRMIIQIDELDMAISDTEAHIVLEEEKIAALEAENLENVKNFGNILSTLYMSSGESGFADLLGSSDFFELLLRNEMATNVSERNYEFMEALLQSIADTEDMIESLEYQKLSLQNDRAYSVQKKEELEAKRTSLEAEKAELQTSLDTQLQKLYTYTANYNSLASEVSLLKKEIEVSQAEMDEVDRQITLIIQEKQRAESGRPVYSTEGFLWPLDSKFQNITTYYGYDAWRNGNHYGIDIASSGIAGSNIYAAQSGTVLKVVSGDANTWGGGFGNYIIIDHGGGISTLYAHCAPWTIQYSEGQTVEKGDVLASVGMTGWATGYHLHFEVRVDGYTVNPFNYSYENSNF